MCSKRTELAVLQCLVQLSALIKFSANLELLDVEFNATDQYHVTNYRLPREWREPCEFTRDCRTMAYHCSDAGRCECASGYRPDLLNETCIGAIGSRCMYDVHCISNAYCRGQMFCTCKEEFPTASDNGWYCEDDTDSGTFSLILCGDPRRMLLLLLLFYTAGLLKRGHPPTPFPGFFAI